MKIRQIIPVWLLLVFAASISTPAQARIENTSQIRQKTFEKVWQIVNDNFWDPTFGGVDWKAIRAKYDLLYRRSVRSTFAFGCVLILMLAIMSFIAQMEISTLAGIIIVGLSILPAIIIFARLWHKSSRALEPIKAKLTKMETGITSPDA